MSVVIPCFNMPAAHLDEAVASVMAQTHPTVEVVITDDGSTSPDTLAALENARAAGHLVVRQPHAGVGAALNRGIVASSGEFFLPLGDDRISPPYLAEAVAVLLADDNVGVVYCHADQFGDQDGAWLLPEYSVERQLFENCIFAPSVYRTADWRLVGGFDEQIEGLEDYDFIQRLLTIGRTVRRLDGTYFHYRRTPRSLTGWLTDEIDREVAARARMFRTNTQLYSDNAEVMWRHILDLMRERNALSRERNDLFHRYRVLERARQSRPGGQLWRVARALWRSVRGRRRER